VSIRIRGVARPATESASNSNAVYGLSVGLLTALVAFIGLWIFGHRISILFVGVMLLDAGIHGSGFESNENLQFTAGGPSRVNTIY
jgi:hypothetical protein